MYNHIPKQFINSGKFEAYLKENNIAIIHFVREAKVLNYASMTKRMEHTTSAKRAEFLHHIPKHEWDDITINWTLGLEKKSGEWDERIASWAPDGIRGYYLRYEDLIMGEDRCKESLSQVMTFLQPSLNLEHIPPVNIHSKLLALHTPTCDDRIENYEEFAAHPRMVNSKTVVVCNMLNEYFAK